MSALLSALGCTLALMTAPVMAQDKANTERKSAEWLAPIQVDKKSVVARSMDLTPEASAKLWPLYESFQRELAVP